MLPFTCFYIKNKKEYNAKVKKLCCLASVEQLINRIITYKDSQTQNLKTIYKIIGDVDPVHGRSKDGIRGRRCFTSKIWLLKHCRMSLDSVLMQLETYIEQIASYF